MDEFSDSRVIRLKCLRKVWSTKDRISRRNQTINEFRKEKRNSILNVYRKLDTDWVTIEDSIDSEINVFEMFSIKQLIEYIINRFYELTEHSANDCVIAINEKIKSENCEEFNSLEFYQMLTAILDQNCGNSLKASVLELIQTIMGSTHYEFESILKSRMTESILNVIQDFNKLDKDLAIKTITVLQSIANIAYEKLSMEVKNGFFVLIDRIVESVQLKHKKDKLIIKDNKKELKKWKSNLIRATSQTLVTIALNSKNTDVIPMLSLFEKLFQIQDSKVVENCLIGLTLIIRKDYKCLVNINPNMIITITQLFNTNSTENIILNTTEIWTMIMSNDSQTLNIINQTRLLSKINVILIANSSPRVINAFVVFMNKFTEFCFSTDLLMNSEMISYLMNVLIRVSDEYFTQYQLLPIILKVIFQSNNGHVLTRFLDNGLIYSISSLLDFEDTNLTNFTLESYLYVLNFAQTVGLINYLLSKDSEYYLYQWIHVLANSNHQSIATKAHYIKTNFLAINIINIPSEKLFYL